MPRTTADRVQEIIDVEDADVAALDTTWIVLANELTTEHCVDSAGTNSDTRLELIEQHLAAHFYTVKSLRASGEGVQGIWERFQYKIELGLNHSQYGQTAMQLDSTGGLAEWNASVTSEQPRRKAVAYWVGGTDTD